MMVCTVKAGLFDLKAPVLASSDMDRAIYEIPGACLITTKVSPRRQPGWSDPAFGLALAFNCHHWKVRQRRMWFDYREVFASVKSNIMQSV